MRGLIIGLWISRLGNNPRKGKHSKWGIGMILCPQLDKRLNLCSRWLRFDMRFNMINVRIPHEIDLVSEMAQILLVWEYHTRLSLYLRWLKPVVMIWLVWGYHTLKYFPNIVLDSLIDLWIKLWWNLIYEWLDLISRHVLLIWF